MPDSRADFLAKYASLLSELAHRGGAEKWRLPPEAMADAVYAGISAQARNALTGMPEVEIKAYFSTLNAQDLVLACACRNGISSAWEEFVTRYRQKLYVAARSLTHDEARARELADSLYAELYGLEERDGVRRSLLRYFHGRSSLVTWLRAVLAQRFVDSHRSEQRWTGDDPGAARELSPDLIADVTDPPDPERGAYINALSQALAAAIGELRPRDRMRLSLYYVESLTLKEIGVVIREHESTVSRRLARTRSQLRKQVERALRRQMHFSEDQIRQCYDYATEAGLPELGQLLPGADDH